jgi:Tfp pilus assembly protein PilF
MAAPGDLLTQAVQYHKAGNLPEAEHLYRQILLVDPQNFNALHLLGVLAYQTGQHEVAVERIRQALRVYPDFPEAHNSLGAALRELGRLEEAETSYRQALRLRPDYSGAHNNRGNILRFLARPEEAALSFQEAIRFNPNNADAHKSLGMMWLLLGKFEQGWAEYEWRWRCSDFVQPNFPQPPWDGAALEGRTILLRAEQGLGDTLQFIRYASLVKARGGTVLVVCHEPLVRVLHGCPGIDRLLPMGSPLPPFDVHAPLLSLPRLFGTTVATVPAPVPYLVADAPLAAPWHGVLSQYSGFKIGIVWQGNPRHKSDRYRSCPLTQFEGLARLPGVRLISLQVGPGREQLAALGDRFSVTDLGGQFNPASLAEAAAVVKHLDLVVAVDTAIAHLAGALAVPVWVPLPVAPDWRWLLGREDSPWYPTMRLFRQRERGNWQEVFERMANAVRGLLAA